MPLPVQLPDLFETTTALFLALFIGRHVPFIMRLAKRPVVRLIGAILGLYACAYALIYELNVLYQSQGVNIQLLRTIQGDINSGHWLSLFFVINLGIVTFVHPDFNPIRGGVFVFGGLGFHEFLWNLAYLPTCTTVNGSNVCSWQIFIRNDFFNTYVVATLTFAFYILCFAYFYPQEFRRLLRYLWLWVGYMILWLLAGFPITIDSRLPPPLASVWYFVPAVGFIENGSWFVFTAIIIYAYLEVHPLRENVLYQFFTLPRWRGARVDG